MRSALHEAKNPTIAVERATLRIKLQAKKVRFHLRRVPPRGRNLRATSRHRGSLDA